ncbi:MAG: hypothetical protein F4039_09160 [Gammaproteobacteria bacterium]|nr:hypothetical protein [Gammaproteobacteria bacterium]
MNWRTIFLASTLLFIFFTSNSAVADDSISDNIAECEDLRSECLERVANLELGLKIIIDEIYKEWLKKCDAFYKNCIKVAKKVRSRNPIPGSGWVACQIARGACKGAAWVWKTGANLTKDIITGRGVAICNDVYSRCLVAAVSPFD